MHFLKILFVEGAFQRRLIPFLNFVSRNRTFSDFLDPEDFFGPTRQITLLESTMFLVQSNSIPHFKLGAFEFLLGSIQSIPHFSFVFQSDFCRSHSNASMLALVVSFHQGLKDIYEFQSIGCSEITIQTRLERSIESLHHQGFGISTGRKMMNVFFLQECLKRSIVKLLSKICLLLNGFSTAFFQNLSKRFHQSNTCLGFHRLNPSMFGQDVNDHQKISVSVVVFCQSLYLYQVGHPLMIHSFGHHRNRWEMLSSGFVQGITQIFFEQTLRFL